MLTDERLRSWLNGNQPSRERLCTAVLALDRSYSHIRPRRPEGGPDGGRDMECRRLGEKCFGAVGFRNSVSDSPDDKRSIKQKFRDDVVAAHQGDEAVKAFVFFTNVDLTPSEVNVLERFAHRHGFTHVDIYTRERLRMALDAPEGLSTRYQMLDIELSSAEQAAFFSRFGRELEDLVRGRFDKLEKKLDAIEFSQWRTGHIRSLQLDVTFRSYIESAHDAPERFRVALELQSVLSTGHRGMILGCRDAFWPTGKGRFHFGTKAFYWREVHGAIEDSWVDTPVRSGGGLVGGISVHLNWYPLSSILAAEFDGLIPTLHLTENLVERIHRVRFAIDDYVFADDEFSGDDLESYRPSLGWPEELSHQEQQEWRSRRLGWSIDFKEHSAKLAGSSVD
jgi:hypothetical protein